MCDAMMGGAVKVGRDDLDWAGGLFSGNRRPCRAPAGCVLHGDDRAVGQDGQGRRRGDVGRDRRLPRPVCHARRRRRRTSRVSSILPNAMSRASRATPRKIAEIYGDDREGLADVMDGLFAIARADGAVHEAEMVYLERVCGDLRHHRRGEFEGIARAPCDSGGGRPLCRAWRRASRSTSPPIRRRYHGLVAENHPDKLMARGVPQECIVIATERLAAINAAYERIERERR